MSFDWNWFFAAFAQCAAALIGIIAAFIISKLLGENDKYESIAVRLEALVIKKNDLYKKVSKRHFDWYDRLNIKYSSELKDAIENGEFLNLPNKKKKLEKLFEIEPDLFKVEACIDYLNFKIEKYTPQYSESNSIFGSISSPLANLELPPAGIWDKLSKEKEMIGHLQIECETLIEKIEFLTHTLKTSKKNLNPINITIFMLSIGLLLTVIYPLHFMPLPINESPQIGFSIEIVLNNLLSVKGALLAVLAITIESIFIYFLILTYTLQTKYSKTIKSVDDSWLDIKYYSKYFFSPVDSETQV